MTKAVTTYHMLSSPMIHTPNIVAWAINGYNFEENRDRMIDLLVAGYKLPRHAAKALLSGEVNYSIEGDEVVFTV